MANIPDWRTKVKHIVRHHFWNDWRDMEDRHIPLLDVESLLGNFQSSVALEPRPHQLQLNDVYSFLLYVPSKGVMPGV